MSKRWPADSSLKSMDRKLARGMWSATLSPDASPTDRFKYDLCKKLLAYMKDHDFSQREFAKILGVHESRISEIIHYKIQRVTADKLMSYLEQINKRAVFKVA